MRPSESSYVSIKRTFVNNVGSPYTECQDLTSYSSLLYNYIVNSSFYSTYRQQDCFNLCIQQMIITSCKCSYSGFDVPPFFSLNSTTMPRPCLTLKDYDCYTKKFSLFNPVECETQSCPLECYSVNYDTSISSLRMDSIDNYYAYHNYNDPTLLEYETWKMKFLTIYVYYSRVEYTLIEVTPSMNFPNLLANIGGSMSLIVSVSAFTLFEFIELVALLVHAFFTSATQSNKDCSIETISPADRRKVHHLESN